MDEDEEIKCSACEKTVLWVTKCCRIYSCYNPVCSKCKYCDKHNTLKQLKEQLYHHLKHKFCQGMLSLNNKLLLDYCGLYVNEKNSLENSIRSMEAEIENGLKILQKVHKKKLPDDISRMITSYLY